MTRPRESVLAAIHIIGLWAILVAHPLLDVAGRSPEFFVAHGAEPADIVILLTVLLVGAPAVLAAFSAAAFAVGRRAGRVVTGAVLAVLVAAPASQAAVRLGSTVWIVAALVSAVAGLAAALLYHWSAHVRRFATIASVGAVLVPILFLLKPGIAALLRPARSAIAAMDPIHRRPLPPVVLVVFDEMPLVSLLDRNRGIDARRLPHLAALARDGVWFRNATTVSDYTRWAVPAVLTGRYPKRGEVPTARSHPDTLFTFLSRTHRLAVHETVTRLCPPSLCVEPRDSLGERLMAIAADFGVVAAYVFLTPDLHTSLQLPDLSAAWAGFRAGADGDPGDWNLTSAARRHRGPDRRQVIEQFIERLGSPGPRPAFHFLHPQLPHQPWMLLPDGRVNGTRAPLPSPARAAGRGDDWEIVQNQQRHLLQVGYIDHVVGRLVSRLRKAGLYDRSLIVITADHGVAITKGHHPRNFAPGIAAEIMRVPLILKLPVGGHAALRYEAQTADGQRVSDRNVESVDIAPTVAQVMGAPLPWASDGTSMLDSTNPGRPEKRIWFASARRVQSYPPHEPDIAPVLQRRLETFGEGNVFAIPKPPRFGELRGRRVADLPSSGRTVEGGLAHADVYARFPPDDDALPFDVSGVLRGRSEGAGAAHVAVSVNGVIHAVTRTWTTWPGWLATPPPEVWRPGRNEVGVYLIEEAGRSPALTEVRLGGTLPAGLNLISSEAGQFWNVRQRGFHRPERRGGFRWTRAAASVAVPLHGRRPTGVHLSVARGIERATPLTVAANGCTIFDGTVSRRGWTATLPLDRCRISGDVLTIELRTIGVQPPRDARTLGVAVRTITLVTSDEALP